MNPKYARYKVTTVNGRFGTVYHVIDTEDGEPIASFSTSKFASRAHKMAECCRDANNAADAMTEGGRIAKAEGNCP